MEDQLGIGGFRGEEGLEGANRKKKQRKNLKNWKKFDWKWSEKHWELTPRNPFKSRKTNRKPLKSGKNWKNRKQFFQLEMV